MKGRFIFEGRETFEDSDLKSILEDFPIEADPDNYGFPNDELLFQVSKFDEFEDDKNRPMYLVACRNHPENYGITGYETRDNWAGESSPRFIGISAQYLGGKTYPCLWCSYKERVFIFVANLETESVHRAKEESN